MVHQHVLNKAFTALIGDAATRAVIAEDGAVTLKRFYRVSRRLLRLNIGARRRKVHLESLHKSCIDHIRPITCPLVLISQIQRSGGSLLSQLFDGHPELHAHPHELKFGFPRKVNWPPIDLNDPPQRWFDLLFEDSVLRHFKMGYKKQSNLKETFPFIFLASVQKELFLAYLASLKKVSLRDVFDAYMTAYFGAWLNNQNLFGDKKYITGFTARLAMYEKNMASFFSVYPQGRLISIVRNPQNWYPSAARHNPSVYGNIRESMNLWKASALAMIRNKERFGDRVCLLTFEDLIAKTGTVMQFLAEFIGINYDDILLTPTFNKFPIKANTSFKANQHGIINSTLKRYKNLAQAELDIIRDLTSDVYQKVRKITVQF